MFVSEAWSLPASVHVVSQGVCFCLWELKLMFVNEAWSLPASALCSKLGCLFMGTKTNVCK